MAARSSELQRARPSRGGDLATRCRRRGPRDAPAPRGRRGETAPRSRDSRLRKQGGKRARLVGGGRAIAVHGCDSRRRVAGLWPDRRYRHLDPGLDLGRGPLARSARNVATWMDAGQDQERPDARRALARDRRGPRRAHPRLPVAAIRGGDTWACSTIASSGSIDCSPRGCVPEDALSRCDRWLARQQPPLHERLAGQNGADASAARAGRSRGRTWSALSPAAGSHLLSSLGGNHANDDANRMVEGDPGAEAFSPGARMRRALTAGAPDRWTPRSTAAAPAKGSASMS